MCNDLRPHLGRQDTNYRKAITVEKRVGIGLFYYGHGPTMFTLSEKFGVGESTAHGIVKSFTEAVLLTYNTLITLPQDETLENVIKGFEAKRQFPNCFGAIDCSHFRITTPHIDSYKAYVDRSGHKSVVVQAVVDCNGRFIDVFSGFPGSVHDARIFSHSNIFEALHEGQVYQEPIAIVDGHPIKPYLVGDAGYKLAPYLIVPYPGQNLPIEKQNFNYWHSSTRMIVEQAFGRLKGRFRLLNGVLFVKDPMDHAKIVGCGCILHNLMMQMNDVYDRKWVNGVKLRKTADEVVQALRGPEKASSGQEIRDVLCRHVNRYN